MKRSPLSRGALAATGLQSSPTSTMSARETSAGGMARGMKKCSGFLADRAVMWPKLSRMPSFARMWLAVMMSWMRSSSGSVAC
jgi:hypothetical protein